MKSMPIMQFYFQLLHLHFYLYDYWVVLIKTETNRLQVQITRVHACTGCGFFDVHELGARRARISFAAFNFYGVPICPVHHAQIAVFISNKFDNKIITITTLFCVSFSEPSVPPWPTTRPSTRPWLGSGSAPRQSGDVSTVLCWLARRLQTSSP